MIKDIASWKTLALISITKKSRNRSLWLGFSSFLGEQTFAMQYSVANILGCEVCIACRFAKLMEQKKVDTLGHPPARNAQLFSPEHNIGFVSQLENVIWKSNR